MTSILSLVTASVHRIVLKAPIPDDADLNIGFFGNAVESVFEKILIFYLKLIFFYIFRLF
jgi:hypothetical protein